MRQNDDIFGPSQLNYEAWRDLLRSKCGRYYSEGIEPAAFTGWVRPVSARGFTATDIGCIAIASNGPIEMFDSTARTITLWSFWSAASWQ